MAGAILAVTVLGGRASAGGGPPPLDPAEMPDYFIPATYTINTGQQSFDLLSVPGIDYTGSPSFAILGSPPGWASISGTDLIIDTDTISAAGAVNLSVELTGTLNTSTDVGLITVTAIGPAPVADAAATGNAVEGGASIEIDVLAGSTWPSSPSQTTISIVIESASAGTAQAIVNVGGFKVIQYTPAATGSGVETVDYHLLDSTWGLTSATETVSITVSAAGGDPFVIGGTPSMKRDSGAQLVPAIPSVDTGDYVIAHVVVMGSSPSANVPSGWTQVAVDEAPGDMYGVLFAKNTVGPSDSDVVVPITWSGGFITVGGGSHRMGLARIYRIRGHEIGDNRGSAHSGSGSPATATSQSVSGGGTKRAMMFGGLRVEGATPGVWSAVSGETNGPWMLEDQTSLTAVDNSQSGSLAAYSAPVTTGTPISGGTAAYSPATNSRWSTVSVVAGTTSQYPAAGDDLPAFDNEIVITAPVSPADARASIQASVDAVKAYTDANPGLVCRLTFPAGNVYDIGATVYFGQAYTADFHNFHINGQGATIRRHTNFDLRNAGAHLGRMFWFEGANNWGMYDLHFDGRRTTTGPHAIYHEHHHAIRLAACQDFEIARCNVVDIQSDGISFEPHNTALLHGGATWPNATVAGVEFQNKNFLIRDLTIDHGGRLGLHINGARFGELRNLTILNTQLTLAERDNALAEGKPWITLSNSGMHFEPIATRQGVPAVLPGGYFMVQDIDINNCVYRNTNGPAIHIGGPTQDVVRLTFRNIEIDNCGRDAEGGPHSPEVISSPYNSAVRLNNGTEMLFEDIQIHNCARGPINHNAPVQFPGRKTLIFITPGAKLVTFRRVFCYADNSAGVNGPGPVAYVYSSDKFPSQGGQVWLFDDCDFDFSGGLSTGLQGTTGPAGAIIHHGVVEFLDCRFTGKPSGAGNTRGIVYAVGTNGATPAGFANKVLGNTVITGCTIGIHDANSVVSAPPVVIDGSVSFVNCGQNRVGV